MSSSEQIAALRKDLREQLDFATTVHEEARREWIAKARVSTENLEALGDEWSATDHADIAALRQELDAAVDDVEALRDFLAMRLEDQCQSLDVPLNELVLERSALGWVVGCDAYKRPEDAAFAHYAAAGWQGAACEGLGPLTLMKAAALDLLAAINTFGSRQDACTRYFEAQCTIHADKRHQILEEILLAPRERVKAHIQEIIDATRLGGPAMDVSGLLAVWQAAQPQGLANLAAAFMRNPYGLRAGWPDLTLAKGQSLTFVEVKTTDRLHNSQRNVISRVLRPSGYNVQVLRLRRLKT